MATHSEGPIDIWMALYLATLILFGIGSILSLVFPQLIGAIMSFISMFIGPLIGAFSGVVFGFMVNDRHRRKLENKRKLFYRNLLLHEIRKSIELLEMRKVNLIPVDGWNSLVNSGDMALFTQDQSAQLSDIYFEIQNYNYEAKRVRDAVEEEILHPKYHSAQAVEQEWPDLPEFEQDFSRSNELSTKLNQTTSRLLEKLQVIDEWLNKI